MKYNIPVWQLVLLWIFCILFIFNDIYYILQSAMLFKRAPIATLALLVIPMLVIIYTAIWGRRRVRRLEKKWGAEDKQQAEPKS